MISITPGHEALLTRSSPHICPSAQAAFLCSKCSKTCFVSFVSCRDPLPKWYILTVTFYRVQATWGLLREIHRRYGRLRPRQATQRRRSPVGRTASLPTTNAPTSSPVAVADTGVRESQTGRGRAKGGANPAESAGKRGLATAAGTRSRSVDTFRGFPQPSAVAYAARTAKPRVASRDETSEQTSEAARRPAAVMAGRKTTRSTLAAVRSRSVATASARSVLPRSTQLTRQRQDGSSMASSMCDLAVACDCSSAALTLQDREGAGKGNQRTDVSTTGTLPAPTALKPCVGLAPSEMGAAGPGITVGSQTTPREHPAVVPTAVVDTHRPLRCTGKASVPEVLVDDAPVGFAALARARTTSTPIFSGTTPAPMENQRQGGTVSIAAVAAAAGVSACSETARWLRWDPIGEEGKDHTWGRPRTTAAIVADGSEDDVMMASHNLRQTALLRPSSLNDKSGQAATPALAAAPTTSCSTTTNSKRGRDANGARQCQQVFPAPPPRPPECLKRAADGGACGTLFAVEEESDGATPAGAPAASPAAAPAAASDDDGVHGLKPSTGDQGGALWRDSTAAGYAASADKGRTVPLDDFSFSTTAAASQRWAIGNVVQLSLGGLPLPEPVSCALPPDPFGRNPANDLLPISHANAKIWPRLAY